MNEQATFASVLKEARKKTKLSEREAASIIGTSNSTWARWERGISYPDSLEILDKVCELMNLSFFYMIALICPSVKESHPKEFQIIEDVEKMKPEDADAVSRMTKAMAFCSEVDWI